jgi:DNA polymerase III epsilon subunit-like protein
MLRDGLWLDESEEVWHTDVPCHPMAQKVHRISNPQVADGQDPRTKLMEFLNLAQRVKSAGGVLVAHNAQFDVRLLQQTALNVGIPFDLGSVFCTANALKNIPQAKRGPNCKNADVYSFLGGEPLTNMHQALNDSKATAYIYTRGLALGWW